MCGTFEGVVDFDTGIGLDSYSSYGERDVFLSMYDDNGLYVRSATVGGEANDFCSGVAVSKDGSVYIAGVAGRGNHYFDLGTDVAIRALGARFSSFVSKYDKNLNVIWTILYSGINKRDFIQIQDIECTDDGGVVVGGVSKGAISSVKMPSTRGALLRTGQGDGYDSFVVSVDREGNSNWSQFQTCSGRSEINKIAIGSHGGVVAIGGFGGTMCYDQSKSACVTSNGDYMNLFVQCLGRDGGLQWIKTYGERGLTTVSDTDIDRLGGIWIAGVSDDPFWEVTNSHKTATIPAAGREMTSFLLRLDSSCEGR
jgi:hypothetical protein